MSYRVKESPRGFSGGPALKLEGRKQDQGDPDVVELYAEYMNAGVDSLTWTFRKKAITVALDAFDVIDGFSFTAQDANDHVFDYNYLFLLDTIKYLATGKRTQDLSTWGELITQLPEARRGVERNRTQIEDCIRELDLTMSAEAIVKAWCSWPQGIDDMICTLHILFGEHKTPVSIVTDLEQDTGVR